MEHGQQIRNDCPCMLLIRYPGELNQRARNSLIKNFPIHQIYEGCIAGVGEQVEALEGCWPRDTSVAVLYFDTKKDAQEWYDCTPDIKQPDWLCGVDMVVVPLRTKGSPKPFIEILDISFIDKEKFYCEYVPKCAEYMKDKAGDVAVVSADNIIKLRGLWDPGYIVINQFKDKQEFLAAYCADEYNPIRQLRQESTDATVITAQLTSIFRNRDKLMC